MQYAKNALRVNIRKTRVKSSVNPVQAHIPDKNKEPEQSGWRTRAKHKVAFANRKVHRNWTAILVFASAGQVSRRASSRLGIGMIITAQHARRGSTRMRRANQPVKASHVSVENLDLGRKPRQKLRCARIALLANSPATWANMSANPALLGESV